MPVPGYLGRILAGPDGPAAGTCFQLDGGVVVTAAHVLESIGADTEGAVVSFDALRPGLPVGSATVARLDLVHDLAVLTTSHRLPATVSLLCTTDQHEPGQDVRITGTAQVPGAERPHRHLDALGTWKGGTTCEDGTCWGRLSCQDVMLGMSGAPVRRIGDDAVMGVVSGRYNSADGWLRDSVWVARTEDLRPLLAGLTDLTVRPAPLTGAVDLVLTISEQTVRLSGAGREVSAGHDGVREGLRAAVVAAPGSRARSPRIVRTNAQTATAERGVVSLRRAGRLLAESFLPPPIAAALGEVVRQAERQRLPVRLGIAAPDWPWLPWEALADPVEQRPLALHPLVTVYRHQDAPPVPPLAGPLRIVVAIAAPDGGGVVLDYENELRNVHAAVRGARLGRAQVRVVPFATTAALWAELQAGAAHVLHLSGHGRPGEVDLETQTGQPRPITADTFVAEAIPPGRMPPVISLAACHTAAPAGPGSASFAAELMARGASVVIGTETSVTDAYATRVFSRVYTELTQTDTPDVVAAVAEARRVVQRELAASPGERDTVLAGLDEWGVLSVLAGAGSVTVLDPGTIRESGSEVPVPDRDRHDGLLQREVGEFVGRRREQRSLPEALLASTGVGAVLCGIGGIGKTTLAAELVALITGREPDRLIAVATGEVTVDTVLGRVANALRMRVSMAGDTAQARQAVDYLLHVEEPWQHRWQVLRTYLLPRYPLVLVLDNFEDNLTDDPHERRPREASLAELLATWVRDGSTSRVLITSRFAFGLPEQAQRRLVFQAIGPMSRAETLKLAWSLPAIDRLPDADLERVWLLVGGHPRTLEYLDALLAGGHARFSDVTDRMTTAVAHRFGDEAARVLATSTTLDAAIAVSLTLAADDVLLPALLASIQHVPDARRLLLGLAVYREPVDTAAALFHIGDPDPTAAHTPNYQALNERIGEILTEAGVTTDAPLGWDDVPPHLHEHLRPLVAELSRVPIPPVRARQDLDELLDVLRATSLLNTGPDGSGLFVHRWTATELERLDREQDPDRTGLAGRHRLAAEYWRWRVAVWPQNQDADLHDQLEARYHLLAAGDLDEAVTITEHVCARLDQVGAWDHETELVHDTLHRLPADSPRRATWIHQLGILAQNRGDYPQAELRYQQALDIDEHLGNQAGMATSYHQLGILAQARGDYPEAERRYQQSLDIDEHLGNQAGMATSYHNLGILAQARGDYPEAERRYQQSLDIKEHLGNQAGMATSYGQLGSLAQARGDYPEAERRYQQSLDINEHLGNQAGMATSYGQLGSLAQARGDQPREAVLLHVRSLVIRARLQVPDVGKNITALRELRAILGHDAFTHTAASILDEPSMAYLQTLLDEPEPEPPGGAP